MSANDEKSLKKQNGKYLSDWVKIPFEKINYSSNFEDYACAPEESHFASHVDYRDGINKSSDNVSKSLSHLVKSPAKLEDKSSQMSVSCDVSPSVSPQNSPHTQRRMSNSSSNIDKLRNESNSNSINPKMWFYSSIFPNFDNKSKTQSDYSDKKQITNNSGFKKFCVTNFDINAIGPTSW